MVIYIERSIIGGNWLHGQYKSGFLAEHWMRERIHDLNISYALWGFKKWGRGAAFYGYMDRDV